MFNEQYSKYVQHLAQQEEDTQSTSTAAFNTPSNQSAAEDRNDEEDQLTPITSTSSGNAQGNYNEENQF